MSREAFMLCGAAGNSLAGVPVVRPHASTLASAAFAPRSQADEFQNSVDICETQIEILTYR
jgi:hypothetical protein